MDVQETENLTRSARYWPLAPDAHWIRLLIPVIAVDDKARLPPSGKCLGARTTRWIRATVKQYARLAWVYLWSLFRVVGSYPQTNQVELSKISDSAERKLNCGKMLKPRCKAYLESALGEMSELEDSYEYLPPKNQRKQSCKTRKSLLAKSAPKVIRRPAPSSERAGASKSGIYIIGHR